MYHKIKHHIRRHTHKHRIFILTVAIIIAFGLIGGAINDYYTSRQVINSFHKNFEKTSLAQLNAYSLGIESIIEKNFSLTTSTLVSLAQQSSTAQAVETKDYVNLTQEFQNLTQIDPRFDTINLLDTHGIVVATGNTLPVGNRLVGNDLSSRDYFKKTMATKNSVLSDAFTSSFTGRNIMSFATPVKTSGNGNVTAVVTATISLDGIAKNLKLPTTFLNGLSFALTDSKGDLIINQQGAPDSITNIMSDEPSLVALQTQLKTTTKSEINYLNQKVFAKASAIPVAYSNYYLVSFYDENTYDHDLSVIKSEYNTTMMEMRIRNIILLIIILAIFYRVVKNREEDL